MPTQRRRPKQGPQHHDMPLDFSAQHAEMKRFPSAEELREMDARWGIDRSVDPSEFALRIDRQISQLAGSMAGSISLQSDLFVPFSRVGDLLRPSIWKLIRALQRRRVDHRALDVTARDRFNQALQAAHTDGSYQAISVIHSQDHMMHSSMGPLGTLRFLPWHRLYLFELEDALRQKQPAVTVPYWDYANDNARPDWVWQPPGVVRNTPGAAGSYLPTQEMIDGILLRSSYSSFTFALERYAHNGVHSWCNGTISVPSTAAQDPIFWLLHSNVDRIWDKWQLSNTGVPPLMGSDAVMDPWQPATASDVNDIMDVGYSYA